MDLNRNERKHLKDVAARFEKADLVIKNARVVNVITQEIHEEDILISNGMIVGFGKGEGIKEIDAKGKFIAPNYIDPHIHIESTLLTPGNLNDVMIPRGVGTIIADPHELANVSGLEGIDYMLRASEGLDLDVRINLPSCVPATSFEHSGAILKAKDLKPYYKHPRVNGLAEVMDYFAVLKDDDMLDKIFDAKYALKTVDGHGAILDNVGLDVYATLRITNDHECVDMDGMKQRLRRGIYTFIRQGTVTRNLKDLISAVNIRNFRFACFCTDDKHPNDLVTEGGLDNVVRMAVKEGLDPILAITLGSYNSAICCRLKDKGVIAPGYQADFFLFDDLYDIRPTQVFVKGELVAQNGKIINPKSDIKVEIDSRVRKSINYKPFSKEDIQINLEDKTNARIIKVKPGNVLTDLIIEEVEKDNNNNFVSSVEKDHAKLIVVERHHQTGNIGKAIVKGFGLTKGAIATSVAHDSHNVIAVGTNDEDMMKAIEYLTEIDGGYVVVIDGEVKSYVQLEIGGLMTNNNLVEVLKQLENVHNQIEEIITNKSFNPLLMLSFISLPVIPEVKITDMGLVEVRTGKFLNIGV